MNSSCQDFENDLESAVGGEDPENVIEIVEEEDKQ